MAETVHIKPETEGRLQHFENQTVFSTSDTRSEPRFLVPVDESIAAKYHFVRDRIEDWQRTDPSIVGATAFGSTTKGYADPETSDIDITVFVDADQLGLLLDPDLRSAVVCWDDWYAFSNKARLPSAYADKVEATFVIAGEADEKLPVNAQVFPVSHEYLKVLASFEVKNALRLARYQALRASGHRTDIDDLADWGNVSSDAESLQSIPELMKALDDEPELSSLRDVMTVMAFLGEVAAREATEVALLRNEVFSVNRLLSNLPTRLFNLAITPDLQPYRQTFLKELSVSSEPDVVWQFFVKRLAAFEDSTKHPRDIAKIQYPQTMAEALLYYA